MFKSFSRIFSYIFHPLIITLIGMLILFNSGTALSVVHQDVKRITLLITALFTIVFPISVILLLYFTKTITDLGLHEQKERVLPITMTIILHMFTFFVMRSIPQLSGGHIVFLFCPPATLFFVLVLNNFVKPSIHMAGMGMLIALLLVLLIFYGAKLEVLFIIAVISGGILGTSRMLLKLHKPGEIALGFLTGLLVSGTIMIIYIL